MPKSRSYQDELMMYLQDSERAVAYLNSALEEGDSESFLIALRNVAQSRGKSIDSVLSNWSTKSGDACLEWHHLVTLLKGLGMGLTVNETSKVA